MKTEATGLIRVTRTPDGYAPREVRGAWVGLTLPCYPVAGTIPADQISGVAGDKRRRSRRISVIVPREEALAVLRAHKPGAAKWWEQNTEPGLCLAFNYDDVEVVSGVQMQRVTEITDEMMGDPNR